MSYCRFSSDDYQCDIYCYESVGDFWAIHVAGRRPVFKEPLPPQVPYGEEHRDAWIERYEVVSRMVIALDDEAGYVDIGLPHDGATFREATASDAADRLEYLRGLGYNVPQYAIDALREEAAELERAI